MELADIRTRLRSHAAALVPGLLVVALMLVWAVHNGGYDSETWYWGALATLGVLAATIVGLGGRIRVSRGRLIVLGLFAAYVAWCYLSMAWAQSPGNALDGANQALLYLMVFAVMLLVPWTAEAGLLALLTWVIGVGVVGVVLLFRLAAADHVASLVISGRLAAPTGYINATAALFTIDALAATALASRREIPGVIRGLLFAFACSGLQLAVIVQSRGWLFTLPLVAVAAIFVVKDRLRVTLAALLPLAGALLPLHRLLSVYRISGTTAGLDHVAARAGQAGLLICAAVFVLGTLLAWADSLWPVPTLSRAARRAVGTAIATVAVVGLAAVGTYATHGHPFRFIARQWNGFSHVQQSFSTQSHFGDVGTSRYDFWRVALDAAVAHPVGGLGEDNFADYYVKHRRTSEEPSWAHSLELRLLAQTGVVGFVLLAAFIIGAVTLAARARRKGPPLVRAVAGVALLPLVVWLIHGSLDWFWEIPALSGPALGFLGMAAGLEPTVPASAAVVQARSRPRRLSRWSAATAGLLALLAGVIVLGLPYLSVREVSLASNSHQPAQALRDLSRAADLNPFSATPGRIGGALALRNGQYTVAQTRFRQAIAREPGGWLGWLGAGLAASALGDRRQARRDFETAYSINSQQPAVVEARKRVATKHPLTSDQAFKLFVIRQ